MRSSKRIAAAALISSASITFAIAQTGDIEAGKVRAQAVCAACHGANGLSVADTIPNLAGQRQAYLQAQLRALKGGTRRAPSMNAIASQLGPEDIVNVAAYYASLSVPLAAGRSAYLPALARSRATLPASFPEGFTKYQTVNRPDIGQVRYLYANAVAVAAARDGKPLPDGSLLVLEQFAARVGVDKVPVAGSDGYFERDRLLGYTTMERAAGWGEGIPEMLRNEDWNYAAFSPAREPRTAANQADCLACHKPLDRQSYLFSAEALKQAASPR